MSKGKKFSDSLTSLADFVKEAQPGEKLSQLPVEKIQRGRYQPRKHFDNTSLQELADSIKRQGVVQPIVVRPVADDFEILAGERRWRAAQLAGLAEIPALVREVEDKDAAALALVENIQREDLSSMEEAIAIANMAAEFGGQKAVVEATGKPKGWVSKRCTVANADSDLLAWIANSAPDAGFDGIYELVSLHKEHPQIVGALMQAWDHGDLDNGSLRAAVRAFQKEADKDPVTKQHEEQIDAFDPFSGNHGDSDFTPDSEPFDETETKNDSKLTEAVDSKPESHSPNDDFYEEQEGTTQTARSEELEEVFEVEREGDELTLYASGSTIRVRIAEDVRAHLRALLEG